MASSARAGRSSLGACLLAATLAGCGQDRPSPPPDRCASLGGAAACLVGALDPVDPEAGRLEVLAGVFSQGQTLPPPARLHLRVGGRLVPPGDSRTLRAVGETRGEAWTPPLVSAIVYLWARGSTPPGMGSGVSFLAESLPPGTRVCPKPYGQNHHEAACLPAYHIAAGGLLDAQHPGQFIHFLKASEQALRELQGVARSLAQDGREPIKWMVLITDGRDHQNGTEGELAGAQTRRDFAAFGSGLRSAGVLLQVVSFPCAGDRRACEGNVSALVEAAGAAHFPAADERQLEEKIRRAAMAWLELKWLTIEVPWYLRWSGPIDLSLEGALEGRALGLSLGSLAAGRSSLLWLLPLLLLAAAGLVFFSRRLGRSAWLRPAADANDLAASRRVFAVIGEARSAGLTPRRTSRRIRALLSREEWAGFTSASRRQLRRQLDSQRAALPTLRATGTDQFLTETQRELREDLRRAVVAAWLVVSSGSRQGQTIRLSTPNLVLGSGSDGQIDLADLALQPRHAEIVRSGARFLLRPLEGPVSLGGEEVVDEQELADGDQLTLGRASLVFKAVVTGSQLAPSA
jgi:hypothetical protein